MNILEMIAKNSPHVSYEEESAGHWNSAESPPSLIKARDSNGVIRGFNLDRRKRVVIRSASIHFELARLGHAVLYMRHDSVPLSGEWRSGERSWKFSVSRNTSSADTLEAIHLPACPFDSGSDLILSGGGESPTFVGIHYVLSRDVIISSCKGTGVEIGPGPKPQILPSEDVSVRYVEQYPPDKWAELYGPDSSTAVDPNVWAHYVIGTAENIPIEHGSLDFVFSSHLLEHLANPLGHLKYWASLLRPGGKIYAVIPDKEGCKDYVFPSSSLDELMTELASGQMEVTREHYRRWMQHRMPRKSVDEVMASGRSIHVHFYTPRSLDHVLSQTYSALGFSAYEVLSKPNYRDFIIALKK